MRLVFVIVLIIAAFALAETPTRADSAMVATAVPDTIVDTVYIYETSGIPWNNEYCHRR